eukprot:2613980-Ditylum_brightwellii.AAC.1
MVHGCTFICPEQKISAKVNADMFVDDATLLHNAIVFNTTAIQLMEQIKHDSKLWDGLVWSAGGLLEFRKSTYFLVICVFTSAPPSKPSQTSRHNRQCHTTTTSLTIRQHKNVGCSQSNITRQHNRI